MSREKLNRRAWYTAGAVPHDLFMVCRVRRIKGQINAIEKALDGNEDCSNVLQTIAACRGAINGLMAEIMVGHIRFHVIDSRRKPTSEQTEAAEELIELVNRYLK
jgi:DNA-binding FrmR family transcriptional regulator